MTQFCSEANIPRVSLWWTRSLCFHYFRAPEINVAAAYVKDKGGTIINGPMEIPGGDFVFTAIDPQGALFSLIGQRT